MSHFLNFLLYQIGWLSCVLGAAWGYPGCGMSIACCLLAVHFALATDRLTQWRLLLVAAAVGLLVDSLLLWAGAFVFPSGVIVPWLPPPWMTVLWVQFATTFHYSLQWMSRRYALSACFGLLGAPLAFFAGEKLGAVEFLAPRATHYGMLALLWSVAVPLLIRVSDRLASRRQIAAAYRVGFAFRQRPD